MENSPGLDDFDKVFGPQSTERIPSPLNEAHSPDLPHAPMGKASFWLAIASLGLWLIGMTTGWGIIVIAAILSILCNLLGVILGIIAISRKGYKKGYAIAGTVINALVIVILVIVIIVLLSQF